MALDGPSVAGTRRSRNKRTESYFRNLSKSEKIELPSFGKVCAMFVVSVTVIRFTPDVCGIVHPGGLSRLLNHPEGAKPLPHCLSQRLLQNSGFADKHAYLQMSVRAGSPKKAPRLTPNGPNRAPRGRWRNDYIAHSNCHSVVSVAPENTASRDVELRCRFRCSTFFPDG